jgi:hypothetical protein
VPHLVRPALGIYPKVTRQRRRVLRITWKLAQSRSTVFNLGRKLRRQQFSFESGEVTFSDGNTHASGFGVRQPFEPLIQQANSPD